MPLAATVAALALKLNPHLDALDPVVHREAARRFECFPRRVPHGDAENVGGLAACVLRWNGERVVKQAEVHGSALRRHGLLGEAGNKLQR